MEFGMEYARRAMRCVRRLQLRRPIVEAVRAACPASGMRQRPVRVLANGSNHLPCIPSRYSLLLSLIVARSRSAAEAQARIRSAHVDNPADRVKFRRSQDGRDHIANDNRRETRENSMAVAEEKPRPTSREELARGGAANAQAQRHPAGALRSRPRADDADQEHSTPIRSSPTFPTAREEEAVGIVSGAWMGGMRGAVLMQTSGFATLANVLASLAVPYQIPLIMFVSERGTLGEFNYGQSLVCRTMRPVLDSLAMEHHTCTRLDEFEFIVDRSIKQAITTQAPVALILSPLLTGGKVFDK